MNNTEEQQKKKDLDVFISYSHCDRNVADGMCAYLENVEGLHCWYAPRDITPGASWPDEIVYAIERARYFVVIFSENSNRSRQVLNEITNAFESDCILIPFKLCEVQLKGGMSYYLKGKHWLDAITPPLEKRYAELAGVIKKGLGSDTTRKAVWRKWTQGDNGRDVHIPFIKETGRSDNKPLFDIAARLITPVAAMETLEADKQIEEGEIRYASSRRFRHFPLISLFLAIIFSMYFCWVQFPENLTEGMTIDQIGIVWGPLRGYLAEYSNFESNSTLYGCIVFLYPIICGIIVAFMISFLVNNLYYKPRAGYVRRKGLKQIQQLEFQEQTILEGISSYICYIPMECRTSERLVSLSSDFSNGMADNMREAIQLCGQKDLNSSVVGCLWEIPYEMCIGNTDAARADRNRMIRDEAFLAADQMAENIMFSE